MISKILIIGNRTESIHELKQKLVRNRTYSVKLVESIDMAVTSLSHQAYHLVIMDLEHVTDDRIQLASNLKRLGYGFPILILGKTFSKTCFAKVEKISRLILLEKPFEEKDFMGIVSKMITGRDIKQKQHRRFRTNQPASLALYGQDKAMPAKMLNLSKGGANIELGELNVEVGKIIKLNIELDQMSRQYEVNARIVWVTNGSKEGRQIGLEFIHASDVYRNLLSDL